MLLTAEEARAKWCPMAAFPLILATPQGQLPVGVGKRTRFPVHCLVANKFLPPRPSPSHQIRHIDGDKTNNRAENLAWGTPKENADDRELHGRTSRGPTHSSAIRAAISKMECR